VLTNREHIIALDPLDKGLMGTLLRYPYEVRSDKEPRKVASGQKEMLMPIAGKKPKEAAAKKPAAKPQRKSA